MSKTYAQYDLDEDKLFIPDMGLMIYLEYDKYAGKQLRLHVHGRGLPKLAALPGGGSNSMIIRTIVDP